MERFRIEALPREKGSKGSRKELRRRGVVPAVLYGRGIEPKTISIDWKDLNRALSTGAGSNVLLDLDIKGSDGAAVETVMIRELQRHPIQKDFVLHADLIRISMEEKLEVSVPLNFIGEPAGAQEGAVLQIQVREVSLSCLPADIPEYIDVSVENMQIGDVLTIADLELPGGIEILDDPADSIASVLVPHVEEEPVAEEEEEEAEGVPVEEEGLPEQEEEE